MHRHPLTRALCAAIWPWTEGRISPWWLGAAIESGWTREWTMADSPVIAYHEG